MVLMGWLSRDGRILMVNKATRSLAYGISGTMLAIYLKTIGVHELAIGVLLTASLLGSICFNLATIRYSPRFGRRRMLIAYSSLMFISGLIFLLTRAYLAMLIATVTGLISVASSDSGPFLILEQSILPNTCAESRRTLSFSVYSAIGSLFMAFGALLVGSASLLQSAYHLPLSTSLQYLFAFYTAMALLLIFLYSLVSPEVAEAGNAKHTTRKLSPDSRKIVSGLSGLFMMDAFGGGLVIQSLVAYWFFERFHVSVAAISIIFFAANVISATSFFIAVKLADRIGLIRTMVFTHIPSNILLMLVAVAPSLAIALAFYLGKMSLSQMDVPTRQSYVVSVVEPEERTAASGYTNTARGIAQSTAPSAAGYVIQAVSLSAPFFMAGALKIAYDLLLYRSFRHIRPPAERQTGPQRAEDDRA